MRMVSATTLALVVILSLDTGALAQASHGHHGTHGAGHARSQSTDDMNPMIGAMRRMLPMMEKAGRASPAERERIMNEIRPLMQELMPAMHAAIAGPGAAGASGGGHQGHGHPAASTSPSTRAFEAVNEQMHRDMAIVFTGNADIDFVRGMIPHHQGAIDMARVALEHGGDAWVRNLAVEIVAAQEREIAEMRAWLARNSR